MGRLDEKFAKAGGVVQRVEKRIEDRLDALISREDTINTKTDTVFARQMAPVEEADKALDALDSKLNLLSNGGPDGPLPGSGDSQASPVVSQNGSMAVQQPEATKTNPAPPNAQQTIIGDQRAFDRMG